MAGYSFILVLGLGGYGLAYSCSEHDKKLLVKNEQAFCEVLTQIAVNQAVHETEQAFITKLRQSIERARERSTVKGERKP